MLCLSGFELYSRWVPLKLLSYVAVCNHGDYGEILFQLQTDHE